MARLLLRLYPGAFRRELAAELTRDFRLRSAERLRRRGAMVWALWLVGGVASLVVNAATFGAVAALLTAVTLLACYIPSRSATRRDPLDALRLE